MNNFSRDLGYTGVGDKSSNCRKNLLIDLPTKFAEMQSKTLSEIETEDLEGQGPKNLSSCSILL